MLWQIKSHVISKHYFCTDNKKKHGTNIMKIFIYKIEIWNLIHENLSSPCRICKALNF